LFLGGKGERGSPLHSPPFDALRRARIPTALHADTGPKRLLGLGTVALGRSGVLDFGFGLDRSTLVRLDTRAAIAGAGSLG
jgi:hypothetical protein